MIRGVHKCGLLRRIFGEFWGFFGVVTVVVELNSQTQVEERGGHVTTVHTCNGAKRCSEVGKRASFFCQRLRRIVSRIASKPYPRSLQVERIEGKLMELNDALFYTGVDENEAGESSCLQCPYIQLGGKHAYTMRRSEESVKSIDRSVRELE